MFQPIQLKNNRIYIIDQTLLPFEEKWIEIQSAEDMYEAIKNLRIRGAPALGIAGILGLWSGVCKQTSLSGKNFLELLNQTGDYLKSARPTAVNLFWAIDRGIQCLYKNTTHSPKEMADKLLKEALDIWEEDIQTCRLIGEHGNSIIEPGNTILTHCNAGALATGAYGTALSVIYTAHRSGKNIHVFVDETRPLLQGGRLTTWELLKNNVPCTLICDNMAAHTIKTRNVNLIITGADRIALNGDTANKIGTYNLGIIARYHNIPLYIAAPLSTFDENTSSGESITIEQRDPGEIRQIYGKPCAPSSVPVYNPAFDIIPHSLVTGYITEEGIYCASKIPGLLQKKLQKEQKNV